jgi:hypothetical protein
LQGRFFKQLVGIPQGSILSSLLCKCVQCHQHYSCLTDLESVLRGYGAPIFQRIQSFDNVALAIGTLQPGGRDLIFEGG